MSDKVEIIFYPDGRRVLVKKGTSILQAAIDEGIDIVSLCGGKGVCGKCKVIIEKGEVGYDLDEKELKHLSKEEITQNYRLACRIKVQNDLVVRIPIESRTGKQRLQVEGIITPVEIDSIIRKYHLTIEPPTLKDTASDMDRINQYLLKNYKIERLGLNFDLLKEFGTKIRNYDWNFTITVWDNQQIISVENNDTKDQVYGFALDIGTTKLAAYLLNLNNGEVVAVESLMNPQIPFGEDVIARIGYKDHLKLQDVLLEGLNVMFEKLCQKANVNKDYVYDLSVVGNPTMIHLFLGIDPKQIGAAPYVPVITNAVNTCNEKFGLYMNKLSKIYTLPIISGYVGADMISGLILR
ncbi:MAG: 2Fe-2S iron-sulfur cluster-binding protein [Candidatus Helarchaeota archaeon]